MSGKRLFIFALLSFLLFVGVVLIIRAPKDSKNNLLENLFGRDVSQTTIKDEGGESSGPGGVAVSEEKPVVIFETTSSGDWEKEKEYELLIAFKELTDPSPTALTLQIIYDPEYIEVIDISEGNLWTGANILEKKIDNDKGQLMFSVGQDFSAEVTGDSTLASLKVKVIKDSLFSVDTQLEIGPESAVASVGVDKLILLQGLPLEVKIKK